MFEKSSVLYQANLQATEEVIINQGGTSSGKTYSILQALFTILANSERKVATVIGQDIPNLRVGALRDALEIYETNEVLKQAISTYNKSALTFTFHNGSILEFKSYDGQQDAKSGKRDYAFFNEANGIPYPVYQEIYWRTKERTFIDYNPNGEFWVHEELIGKPDHKLFITDHRHNPFCPEKTRVKIEALKDKDEELWRVYARGLTGKIEGLVYRDWSVCEAIPEGAKYIATGIDFGFANDVTAIVDVYLQNGQLWLMERIYETGLTNTDIGNKLIVQGFDRRNRVVADSAEPKSIEDLRRAGFNIEGAQKGPDSVDFGINLLKGYHLNVTRGSVNLRKELSNYKWAIDKISGKSKNVPVDAFNHALDCTRYVALNCLAKDKPKKQHFSH
jgi:phage terminase large subunit